MRIDASQSRISDHIELPENNKKDRRDDDNNNNENGKRNHTAGYRRNAFCPFHILNFSIWLTCVCVARLLQGPDLKWHKEYAALDQHAGRVLMIDFARSDKLFPSVLLI